MKRIVAVLAIALSSFWATWLWAQTGVPMSKGTLNSTVNTIFQDNTSGNITPFLLRQGFLDVVSSMQQFGCISAQTGTTYTFLTGDYGCLVTFRNGSAVSASLPAANAAGFSPWNAFISNYGSGSVTITPATGTIGGSSNFILTAQQGMWVVSDGTNYQFFLGSGSGGGGSGSLTIGQPIIGGTANSLLYADGTSLLADNGPFVNTTFALPTGNGQWTVGATNTLGMVMAGQGSTDDFQLQNRLGLPIMTVPASTTNVIFNSLPTTPTIANSICSTSAGLLVSNASTNCFAGGAGTPGGATGQIQFNSASSFGGDAGFTVTTPGIVTITSGIITTNARSLSIATTWNSSGVTFDAPLFLSVTNNAAAAGSALADFQLGGFSAQKISRLGATWYGGSDGANAGYAYGNPQINFNPTSSSNIGIFVAGGTSNYIQFIANAGGIPFGIGGGGASISANYGLGWSATNDDPTATKDVQLFRESGGILGQRNGGVAQTHATYNTYTSATVNERAVMDWQTLSNTLTVGALSSGTGVARSMRFVAGTTTTQALVSTTSTSFAAALNIPAISQLATVTTGYVCWTTGTGALSEDSTTCLSSLGSLKKNINPFGGATTELMALKPSIFEWKAPADRNQQGPQLGFIAEDVASVDPKLATHTSNGNLRGWQEPGMIALLVRGFQEQQQEIAALKAQLRASGR